MILRVLRSGATIAPLASCVCYVYQSFESEYTPVFVRKDFYGFYGLFLVAFGCHNREGWSGWSYGRQGVVA